MRALENIKLVVSDFDGIFTDGKLTVYSDGNTSKIIDYKDIMAIAVIIKKDINFAILSGDTCAAIDIIKKHFPSIDIFQNQRKKINILLSLAEQYNVKPHEIVYIGDDINDIECLKYVGNPITVPNAHSSVKEIENIIITTQYGGNGAIREIADSLL
ncbi:HAD hydrolase family protein [bacterium]|nr:HAD hydrolase family protein [bacterium]